MITLNGTLKSLFCGAAAAAITLTLSWTVVHSTATFPWATEVGTAQPAVAKVALQPRHQWFGQPAPAVLVD
jgi:hypothetical protein